MKKLLIVLLFTCSIGWGQEYRPLFHVGGKILVFAGQGIAQNQLLRGLKSYLDASLINVDSLTYNSTAQLVTYANADTVVLDGSLDVVIGNSVRFGTPTSGTIYEILDTLGSSDTLILDQTFTGSVTDEFFWGGVGKWYDESGKGYNATQTTAVYQPKLSWANTDSAEVRFDGIDDYLILPLSITNILNINNTHSVFVDAIINQFVDSEVIIGSSVNSNNRYSIGIDNVGLAANVYNGTRINKGYTTTTLDSYKMISLLDDFSLKLYVDNVEYSSNILIGLGSAVNTTYIGASSYSTPLNFFSGGIKEIRIYDRILTAGEIQALSQ